MRTTSGALILCPQGVRECNEVELKAVASALDQHSVAVLWGIGVVGVVVPCDRSPLGSPGQSTSAGASFFPARLSRHALSSYPQTAENPGDI